MQSNVLFNLNYNKNYIRMFSTIYIFNEMFHRAILYNISNIIQFEAVSQ